MLASLLPLINQLSSALWSIHPCPIKALPFFGVESRRNEVCCFTLRLPGHIWCCCNPFIRELLLYITHDAVNIVFVTDLID